MKLKNKEKQIYTNPTDNFKRRTIVLVRSANKKVVTPLGSSKLRHNLQPNESNAANSQGEFGFHLQTYGLVNSSTKQTEFICFCNNVQPQSPAQQVGFFLIKNFLTSKRNYIH
jgi:hypothetical protein